LTRRDFLKGAAVVGGALVFSGLGARQVYHHQGRDFQPGRAQAYKIGA